MAVVSGIRAVVVECIGLKPCWVALLGSNARKGRMSLSRTLLAGQRREIGLYDFESAGSFPGFGKGITVASFHISGMVADEIDALKILQRKVIPKGPRCFK